MSLSKKGGKNHGNLILLNTLYKGGTPTKIVTLCLKIALITLLKGLRERIITIFAPRDKGRIIHTKEAKEWNKGRIHMKQSLLLTVMALQESRVLEMRL